MTTSDILNIIKSCTVLAKIFCFAFLLMIGKFIVDKIGWFWLFVIFGGAFLLYMLIILTLAIRSVREENRRKYGKKDN